MCRKTVVSWPEYSLFPCQTRRIFKQTFSNLDIKHFQTVDIKHITWVQEAWPPAREDLAWHQTKRDSKWSTAVASKTCLFKQGRFGLALRIPNQQNMLRNIQELTMFTPYCLFQLNVVLIHVLSQLLMFCRSCFLNYNYVLWWAGSAWWIYGGQVRILPFRLCHRWAGPDLAGRFGLIFKPIKTANVQKNCP